MLPRQTTRKAAGSVLLERQCVGSDEHRTQGLPVRTNSPPIPGKLIPCCDGGTADEEDPQPAELEDAGRLAPLTPAANDVILPKSEIKFNLSRTVDAIDAQ
jgi:hypothetical protein